VSGPNLLGREGAYRYPYLYILAWNPFIISKYLYIQNHKPFIINKSWHTPKEGYPARLSQALLRSPLYIHARNPFIINKYLYIQNRKPFAINESGFIPPSYLFLAGTRAFIRSIQA
jgi:hypothetical protein